MGTNEVDESASFSRTMAKCACTNTKRNGHLVTCNLCPENRSHKLRVKELLALQERDVDGKEAIAALPAIMHAEEEQRKVAEVANRNLTATMKLRKETETRKNRIPTADQIANAEERVRLAANKLQEKAEKQAGARDKDATKARDAAEKRQAAEAKKAHDAAERRQAAEAAEAEAERKWQDALESAIAAIPTAECFVCRGPDRPCDWDLDSLEVCQTCLRHVHLRCADAQFCRFGKPASMHDRLARRAQMGAPLCHVCLDDMEQKEWTVDDLPSKRTKAEREADAAIQNDLALDVEEGEEKDGKDVNYSALEHAQFTGHDSYCAQLKEVIANVREGATAEDLSYNAQREEMHAGWVKEQETKKRPAENELSDKPKKRITPTLVASPSRSVAEKKHEAAEREEIFTALTTAPPVPARDQQQEPARATQVDSGKMEDDGDETVTDEE